MSDLQQPISVPSFPGRVVYRDELDAVQLQLRDRIDEVHNRTEKNNLDLRVLETNVEHNTGAIKRLDASLGQLATRDQIATLQRAIDTWDTKMVTQDQFSPVRMIIYGMVGLILIGVMGALIALVVIRPGG